MGCLTIDFRSHFLFVFLLSFLFRLWGFWLSPPTFVHFFHFLLILFLRLAVEDGCSLWCQPCWDATVKPWCLTFLLAYQKKRIIIFDITLNQIFVHTILWQLNFFNFFTMLIFRVYTIIELRSFFIFLKRYNLR